MKLPFLKEKSSWPIMKEPEEKVVNPSYDKQIQDSLVDDLFKSLESKDSSGVRESLQSLVQCIRDEERGE